MDGYAFNRDVGLRIRQIRLANGWTQRQLAERSEGTFSTAALANYESNHRQMRLAVLWDIARALRVNVSDLLSNRTMTPPTAQEDIKIGRSVILASVDPRLEPIRKWVTASPDEAKEELYVWFSVSAIQSLSVILNIEFSECRDLLQTASE